MDCDLGTSTRSISLSELLLYREFNHISGEENCNQKMVPQMYFCYWKVLEILSPALAILNGIVLLLFCYLAQGGHRFMAAFLPASAFQGYMSSTPIQVFSGVHGVGQVDRT